MTIESKNYRTCKNGHHYHKTSDCPTCPVCDKESKPKSGLLSKLPAPARRALENKGIKTVTDLANYSKPEILALHGIGPGSIPKLTAELEKNGLTFKENNF